jgi:hypothetical protein
MAPPRSSFDREMQVLEGEIKRLEAEYNMFFAGRLPRLPWETRTRVDSLVKRYDRMHIANTADRFRFGTLQSKFAMFCELWERQLKAQEQGRPRPVRVGASSSPSVPAPDEPRPEWAVEHAHAEPPAQPRDRVVHVANLHDPSAQADRVKELYERLVEARREAGEPPVPYDRVEALVRAQVNKFRAEGHDAAFRVVLKNGKVSLTVTKVRES